MYVFLAQNGGDAAGGGSAFLSFLPLILIGALVYFMMIRPQRKRQQAVTDLQKEMAVGDDVITIGGVHGRVDAMGESTVDLEVYDDVVIRFKRSAIAEVVRDEPDEPELASSDDESAETSE